MSTQTSLCPHFANRPVAGNVYYSDTRNTLKNDASVTSDKLAQYLKCSQCQVITPTINNRFFGGLKALLKIIYYFMQRPFAALVSCFINTHLDPVQHPKLVKWGRLMMIPKLYQKIAEEEFSGYFFGGSGGKAAVIHAQFSKEKVKQLIYSSHYNQLSKIVIRYTDSAQGTGDLIDLTDDQMEQKRLGIIRGLDPLIFSQKTVSFFKNVTFQDLIDSQYLVPSS